MAKRTVMTMIVVASKNKLRELKEEYQKSLRMMDWDITLNLNVPRSQFFRVGCVGESFWNYTIRKATINICDPSTMLSEEIDDFDMEETLVHELLHVKFAPVVDFTNENDSLEDRLHHQIIQDCARAIVCAKRSGSDGKK